MRDEHRFREKIELSLENRHVRAIAFAAVLFLGAAFALGVFVGKRLASRAAAPAPMNDLEALDARTPAARAGTLPPPDTARVRDSVASPVPLPPAEPAALPAPPPARTAPVRTIPAPPPTTSVAPARTAQVTAPQTAILPAPPPDVGKFTVQVGATQDKMEAHQMVSLASKGGLRPYVAEARLAGRGLWYRVRVGAFADRAAADQYRRDVERELRMPALVMPTR